MLQEFNPKNENLKVWVKDRLLPREEAKVSVFDSSVQGGDSVWEGLRLYSEGILHLQKHLDRLRESAHALAFDDIPEDAFIIDAIKSTLVANQMRSDVHIRLTLTRGEKITSGMDPRLNQFGSCLIVLAEWKPLVYDNNSGIRVITSSIRRNGPQFLDSKIHHANLLNNILAKIEANHANANAAVMLDDRGFIAELNDTNLFLINENTLLTPLPVACLPGISRSMVIHVCQSAGIDVMEKDISMVELYNADAVFASGTMGQLTPIVEADGRSIGSASGKEMFRRLSSAYKQNIPAHCTDILS